MNIQQDKPLYQESKENDAVCFHFVFEHPIAFRDVFMPKCWGKYFKTRYYQYASSLSSNSVNLGGRSHGKSTAVLEPALLQTLITRFNEESLISSYRKTHIKDRLENVIGFITRVPYFKRFFKGHKYSARESVNRSPVYRIELRNGHLMHGISVGDDLSCSMIIGKHPKHRFLEEAQNYPEYAFVKWEAAKDPKGSLDKYFGVVDGRGATPFRRLDGQIKKFQRCRFHVPRLLESYFNQELKKDAIESLKGEGSEDYRHEMLAEWAEPSWALWSERDIIDCISKDEKERMNVIKISSSDYKGSIPSLVLSGLPLLPKSVLDVIIGIDAGWSQPTVILPFFLKDGRWTLTTRIELFNKMIPDDQSELVDYIATFYRAMLVAIDFSSGEGKSISTSLRNPKRPQFSGKNYEERLVDVEFQKNMIVGYKSRDEVIEEDIKTKTTQILYSFFANHQFHLFQDESILLDFNAESQKKESNRTKIKTPSWVHIPEAFRCFAYAYFLKYGKVERPTIPKDSYEMVESAYVELDFPIFGKGGKKEPARFF